MNIRRGKYAYMSPEQVAGEPLDARSDQFGVGVMLVELLTGVRPFDGRGPADVLENIREAAPPDLSALPPALVPVLNRCFAARPAERFPDALALRDALLAAYPEAARVGPPEVSRWVGAGEHAGSASPPGNPTATQRTVIDTAR